MLGSPAGNRKLSCDSVRRSRSFHVSGSLLFSLRTGRGWTQLEAAERGGVSERLLRKAESGGKIALKSIAMLAQLYSTPQAPLSSESLLAEPRPKTAGAILNGPDMEALVRLWHDEIWRRGRLERLEELTAQDCVLHAYGRLLRGRAAVGRYIEDARVALNSFELFAERPAIYGGIAVAQWRLHPNCSCAMANSAARSGQALCGSTWIRVADGVLCEIWKYWHCDLSPADARQA